MQINTNYGPIVLTISDNLRMLVRVGPAMLFLTLFSIISSWASRSAYFDSIGVKGLVDVAFWAGLLTMIVMMPIIFYHRFREAEGRTVAAPRVTVSWRYLEPMLIAGLAVCYVISRILMQ